MRLWSVHPSYLDRKGLLALWREGLLALQVLSGKTKGYKNHPQLQRFKAHVSPIDAISDYLHAIVDEAETRGYHFVREKLPPRRNVERILLTRGQLQYEVNHLLQKLKLRDIKQYERLLAVTQWLPHSLFTLRDGVVESWEKMTRD